MSADPADPSALAKELEASGDLLRALKYAESAGGWSVRLGFNVEQILGFCFGPGPYELAQITAAIRPVDPKQVARARLVDREAERLRVIGEARRLVDREQEMASFRTPPSRHTLAEELTVPDAEQAFAIEKLLPAGGNAMLAAQFKAGKTTLLLNLARAIADREPFLGRFDVTDHGGRVGIFNYEVGEDQFRRWAREAGFKNPDRVAVWNLRGFRLPLTVPAVEDMVTEWLRERDVRTWIVDPLGRALGGVEENDNTAVRCVLDTLDTIKSRAGVGELIVAAHVGRQNFEAGQERVRGATVLDDWPDARWVLTRDELSGSRFLRASGRDVDVDEEALTFDHETRALKFGGWDRVTMNQRAAIERYLPAVIDAVTATPGMGARDLREALSPARGEEVDKAVREAVRTGRLTVVKRGSKNCHYLFQHGVEAA